MVFINFQSQRLNLSFDIFGGMNLLTMIFYVNMRRLATGFHSLREDDINLYVKNVSNAIHSIPVESFPNKYIRIRPLDPVWLTSSLKKNIRSRKRAYKKAKRTNLDVQ